MMLINDHLNYPLMRTRGGEGTNFVHLGFELISGNFYSTNLRI